MHSRNLYSPACDTIFDMRSRIKAISVVSGLISGVLFFVPTISNAANVAAGVDAMCVQICTAALQLKPPQPCPAPTHIVCTSQGVTGVCMIDGCKAVSTSGLGGGNSFDPGLSQLVQQLGGILQKLMQGGGGGGGGGGSSASSPTASCTSYTPTSDPTQVGVNPCVYYVPSSASQINPADTTDTSASDLLSLLGGQSASTTPSGGTLNVSVGQVTTSLNASGTPSTGQTTLSNVLNSGTLNIGQSLTSPTNGQQAAQQVVGSGAAQGNIVIGQNGVTFLSGQTDQSSNSAVAGFYGSDTIGTQPQGIVANLCVARPWAGGFLSYVIPPSFFDNLCSSHGFQVGAASTTSDQSGGQVPQVTLQQGDIGQPTQIGQSQNPQTSSSNTGTTKSTTNFSTTTPPEVRIWAVPSQVPLGSRTSIYWNTQGVADCIESSPGGSFNENTISGGASTVPLTGSTTYTISCLDQDQNPVTDSVIVKISD